MALERPIVFGNWKMNGLSGPGLELLEAVLVGRREGATAGTLGVFPPATILSAVARAAVGSGVVVGGQDCHEAAKGGAYTGDVSAAMLKDAGAAAVILGHSERRQGHGETDALVGAKVRSALAHDLLPVVCVGETEAEYLAGERDARLAAQLAGSLPDDAPPDRLVVAYEPVWAIGTGRTPTPEEVRGTHAFIRDALAARWKDGRSIPILYGGSVKPDNAAALLRLEGVDGALVGGASLDASGFLDILRAAVRA